MKKTITTKYFTQGLRKTGKTDTEEMKQKKQATAGDMLSGPRPDPPPYPGENNQFRVGQYVVNPAQDEKDMPWSLKDSWRE